MRLNLEYWWSTKEPQVTDLHRAVDSLTVGLPVTPERYWASFQVTGLFHKATIFCCNICICCGLKLHQADHKVEEFLFFLTSIWWGSTQLQCIYYLRRILISRPPRVLRRFKRRSCCILPVGQIYPGNVGFLFALPTFSQWCVVMIGNIKTLALYSIAHCTILLSSLSRIVWKHWTYKTLITYILISVCLR